MHHAAVTPTGGELALFPAAYRLPAHVVAAPQTANTPVASPPAVTAAAVVSPAGAGESVPLTTSGMAAAAATASKATTTTVPATIARRLSMSNCTISTLCNTVAAYAAALPQLCPGSLVVSTGDWGARRSHVAAYAAVLPQLCPGSLVVSTSD